MSDQAIPGPHPVDPSLSDHAAPGPHPVDPSPHLPAGTHRTTTPQPASVVPPARPGEIGRDVGLAELAARVEQHATALFGSRLGVRELDAAEYTRHCLGELVYAAAIDERVQSGRWVVACEALGAGHEAVAAAMGLDVDELQAGLRSWARSQLRHGLIDDARHAEVLALLGEPPATDPADHLATWQLRRLVQLLDALGDPPLSLAERASLIVLAGQDQATVDNLAAVLRRVRGAER